MNVRHLFGPIAGLSVAAVLVFPSRTDAYTLLGGDLALSERHFRVFNNFADPSANDNTTVDPQFPGYDGAELAIWKAYVEWGSALHGNGDGDPHQPFGLGSGGANFDPTWQGNATSVGDNNDNICSAIAGGAGGVIAFLENGTSTGWRMRFYEDVVWHDGPGDATGAGKDLQGTACFLFGYALGLGPSGVAGATMQNVITGTLMAKRSIEPDDIAGVQAIYGAASAGKPVVASVAVAGGSVTVQGSNFAATGNEVWFTQLGTGGSGTPVVASGLSSNGTQIQFVVPANAGPGDLLVKIPGTSFDTLSNAFPFPDSPCTGPTNTCQTSPNSVDPVGALMSSTGAASMSQNNLILSCIHCPANTSGLFFFGANATLAPFGNGFRCVGNPVTRLGIVVVSPLGEATLPLDLNAAPAAGNIALGDTRYFQFWYRNPAGGGAGFNLSDSLRATFCP